MTDVLLPLDGDAAGSLLDYTKHHPSNRDVRRILPADTVKEL
jgi:hypothetical protein